MANYVNVTSQPFKLIEGWLQHKGSQDTKWSNFWCVLKDYVIYIFKTDDTTRDNHIGVLSVGSDTQVKTGDSDPKKGYRFDLLTAKKLNKFKTTKFIERELWKAYLIGLTEGDISDNLDLTPDQIQKVRSDVQRVISGSSRPPLPVSPRGALDSSSVGTGFSSPDNSISSIFASDNTMDDGGPTIRHRFWPNPDKTDVPSWFFTSITRDTAESILTTGKDFGNSLMRESVTFRDTGSYVITKKMEHSRGPPFNHFEVIRGAEGFKINVENAHKNMLCLSEVMEYFVRMSGSAVTRPLVTNDFKVLGLDMPAYQTKIWKTQTNAESGEDDPDYPKEAYEEPSPTYPSNSKTWGPSTRRPNSYFSDNRGGQTLSTGQQRPRPRVNDPHTRKSLPAGHVMDQLDKKWDRLDIGSHGTPSPGHPKVSRDPRSESAILDGLGDAPPPPCPQGRRPSESGIEVPPSVHSRWQTRAKSVPIIQIPPNLEQEVRVNDPVPTLVKPSKTPPRVLPKPPSTGDLPTEGSNPFLEQLQAGRHKLKKDSDGGKHVTFEDIQSTRAQTQTQAATDDEGALDRDALKKKLNLMLGGGGGGATSFLKPVTPTSPPAPAPAPHLQQPLPEEEEEEDYEEIYDHIN